ncbi:hypothetical protein HZA85_01170 [Candidatus Uhrbacteria bacterium]|nr:hypothetical protein [Candidatus Uhrbacteria bacterium]
MMIHSFQLLLDEFAIAIRHFVPTLPKEIKAQATDVLEKLKADPEADEARIKRAFYEIGVLEYPYRRAYQELTSGKANERLKALVLEHVDETVRGVIKPYLDSGVGLEELVKSDLFESQLTPEQRYQVEDGILVASSKLADALKGEVSEDEASYERLVAKWKAQAGDIQKAVDELEALASQGDENQQAEIKGKVARYREGFLITEPDPDLGEVKKEIEYWQETFHPEE